MSVRSGPVELIAGVHVFRELSTQIDDIVIGDPLSMLGWQIADI